MQTPTIAGLPAAEVALRRAQGRANVVAHGSSRSAWEIVRSNLLTRFNAIIGVLLVAGLVFGAPQDALFGLVIVINSAVGIVQELRAKRSLDALALLDAAPVTVRRDDVEVEVPAEDVVLGDLVVLWPDARRSRIETIPWLVGIASKCPARLRDHASDATRHVALTAARRASGLEFGRAVSPRNLPRLSPETNVLGRDRVGSFDQRSKTA